jgi:DNA ligase-1
MKQTKDLMRLERFVLQMKSTSSLLDKKKIIDSIIDDEFIKNVLFYTYNDNLKYYVTSKNCKKQMMLCDENDIHDTIFDLLDDLNSRTYTGHDAIAMVNNFVSRHQHHGRLIFSILDRNLEIRASESVINKVIPGLIPTFEVALATKYEPRFCDFENEEWLASRKLDGVRCIIRKEHESVKAYSRQGNELTTIQKVLDDVALIPGNFVLDGEICLMDNKGNESFKGLMKQIKKKNHQIDNPKYVIFDYLTLEEFDTKKGTATLEDRYINLQGCDLEETDTLSLLDQHPIESHDHLNEIILAADDEGYEGVMVRKNTGYEGKRSKNLLKCKKFHDAEYIVESCDFENHRVIREGKEVLIPMLAQVYITHKGHEVAIGSGWSQEQRIKYEANPEKIIGKTITVQYFEETTNKKGETSLRFPTVKHVYEQGRDV